MIIIATAWVSGEGDRQICAIKWREDALYKVKFYATDEQWYFDWELTWEEAEEDSKAQWEKCFKQLQTKGSDARRKVELIFDNKFQWLSKEGEE